MACSNLSAYLSVCLVCMHPHMHACMSTGLAYHRHLREGQADRAADANAARFSCGLACLHCPRRRLRLSCGYWVKVLGKGLGSRVKRSGLMWALPSAWPWPSPLAVLASQTAASNSADCTCMSDRVLASTYSRSTCAVLASQTAASNSADSRHQHRE